MTSDDKKPTVEEMISYCDEGAKSGCAEWIRMMTAIRNYLRTLTSQPNPMDIALKLNAKAWRKSSHGWSMFDVDKAAEIISEYLSTSYPQPTGMKSAYVAEELAQRIFNALTYPVAKEIDETGYKCRFITQDYISLFKDWIADAIGSQPSIYQSVELVERDYVPSIKASQPAASEDADVKLVREAINGWGGMLEQCQSPDENGRFPEVNEAIEALNRILQARSGGEKK